MQIKEAIVKRIKNICLERGIKYNELATRSGVTRQQFTVCSTRAAVICRL